MLSRPRSDISSRRSRKTDRGRGRRGILDGCFSDRQYGAAHVRVAGRCPAAGLSGGVLARRGGTDLCLRRHSTWRIPARLPAGASRARLWRDEQRYAARDTVLYVHGTGARTIRHGGGPARHHRAAVRHHQGRPCLCGGVRRRAARRHHGRGRGFRDFDGPDLAADHVALRIRPPDGFRHYRGLRHIGADHSAVAGSDRDGRPARQVGRRHVRGRLRSGIGARGPLCLVRVFRHADISQGGSGLAG